MNRLTSHKFIKTKIDVFPGYDGRYFYVCSWVMSENGQLVTITPAEFADLVGKPPFEYPKIDMIYEEEVFEYVNETEQEHLKLLYR